MKNEKKMDNLAEQAIKTDLVSGGKGSSRLVPTPRPDPTIIDNQISQSKEEQESLGSIRPNSRFAPTGHTTPSGKN